MFRGSTLGLLSLYLGCLVALPLQSARATCSEMTWPKVPSLQEARSSTLCRSTPVDARVAALKIADPEGDAARAASRGVFQFIYFSDEREGDGDAIGCTPDRDWKLGVMCRIWPDWKPFGEGLREENRRWLQKVDDTPYALREKLQRKPACVSVYLSLLADYIQRYNRAVVTHPRFPHKDMCKSSSEMKDATYAEALTEQPALNLRPTQYSGIAMAARYGDEKAVRTFIEKGVAVEAGDEWQITALEWAVIRDYGKVFEVAFHAPGGEKQNFCAALEQAIAYKRTAMAIDLTKPCGQQPGPRAVNLRNFLLNRAARDGEYELVKGMVAAGFPTDSAGWPEAFSGNWTARPHRPLSRYMGENTPADPLADAKKPAVVEFLRSFLIPTKEAALAAIREDKPTKLKHMLEMRPELGDEIGIKTGEAIRLAISLGHAKALEQLIAAGANLNIFARDGTPLIFETIGDRARWKALVALLQAGQQNVRSRQPEAGNDADRREYLGLKYTTGLTPLMFAIWSAKLEYRGEVGDMPVQLDPQRTDARHGGSSTVYLLLHFRADMNLKDETGRTALHFAACTDYGVDIAQQLLEAGADINARDNTGRTALDYALERKLKQMSAFLLNHGAQRGGAALSGE